MSGCKNHDNKCNTKKGTNFTAYESGPRKDWPAHTVELPGLGETPGKLFLKDAVGFTGCKISVNSIAPGAGMSIYSLFQY